MNSKDKGNIGESRILFEFVKRGIQVPIPFGDNARYDLIADFGGKLNRIQVKYCNQQIINGSITVPCASSTNHTTNKHYTTYKGDVDYLAFYIPKWDASLLVRVKDISNKRSQCFRKEPTKSGRINDIRLIQDYSFDKALCVETLHDEPKFE